MIRDLFRLLSEPGFLGTRAPLFSDLVVTSLALVVSLLFLGIGMARRGRPVAHGWLMSGTWAILAVVVGAFVFWNGQGGPPPAPRLEASKLYDRVYLPLLGLHISIALLSLVMAPVAATLGVLHYRGPKGAEGGRLARLAELHPTIGRWTFGLLLFTASSGLAIYYFRYLY